MEAFLDYIRHLFTVALKKVYNPSSEDEPYDWDNLGKINTSSSSNIDKSEVDRLRELNKRLRNTINLLAKQNNSLQIQVERLTNKESNISSMSSEEKKTIRDEEIESLQEMNKILNQRLTDEINIRIEGERQNRVFESETEDLKLKIMNLEKTINIKDEMIKLKETENTLERTTITGINADSVDGIGIDVEELTKNILKNAKVQITDIETNYKTKVDRLEKTVTEKEEELAKAHKENFKYTRQIEDYELQISSFNKRIENAETKYSEETSRLHEENQKIKAELKTMEEKTEGYSQTVEDSTKLELDMELNIYKKYLDVMDYRLNLHKKGPSTGKGPKSTGGASGNGDEETEDLKLEIENLKKKITIKDETITELTEMNESEPDLTPKDQPGRDLEGNNENDKHKPNSTGSKSGNGDENSNPPGEGQPGRVLAPEEKS